MPFYIEAISKIGQKIRITKRHWDYIVNKHESIIGLEEQIKETLRNPTYVRLSKEDKKVYLYYKPYRKYFLCVVCRHLNGDGFIITGYLTDNIKKGETVYETY